MYRADEEQGRDGRQLGEEWRSERTITFAPSAMATSTFSHTSSSARRKAGPGSAGLTGNRPSTAKVRQPGWVPSSLMYRSFASSSLVITGRGMTIWLQLSGSGASRLRSGPMVPASEVTSSSRMASSGGLVTWANSCWK